MRNMTWKDKIKKKDMKDISLLRVNANIRSMKKLEGLLNAITKKGIYRKEGEEYRGFTFDYAIKFLSEGIDLLEDISETLPVEDDEEDEGVTYDQEVMRRLREGGDYHEARVNLGSRR